MFEMLEWAGHVGVKYTYGSHVEVESSDRVFPFYRALLVMCSDHL